MKNKQIEEELKNTIENQRVVNGYIFSGNGNTANYEYAKEFAKMILCLKQENGYCEKCKSCIMFDDSNHADYYEINKEKTESIKIDEIREMQTKIYEKPITSSKKVYVINNAEQMGQEAQNCLLKTLEEPPDFVTIILVVNNENLVLPTIKSRCAKILFTEENEDNYTEEQKQRYEELRKIFRNVEKYSTIDLLNKLDILYKDKENFLENLNFINTIFAEKSRSDYKYLDYIDYVEKTKRKFKANSNFDMCVDYLILNIFKQ